MRFVFGILRRLPLWGSAFLVCLLVGELVARLDDWIFQDVPFLASPEREYDLLLHDEQGLRGRPEGRFKKYKLNAFGFRGPEIERLPRPGVIRVMVLGASETFGLYESEGHEYPALLQSVLDQKRKKDGGPEIEIVNAAVAGMTLPTLTDYWSTWANQFRPDVVLIYPSPQFYLDNDPPRALAPRPASDPVVPPGPRSRFLERLKESAKQSDLIRSLRVRYLLSSEMAGKAEDWFFRDVPSERLTAFRADLAVLGEAVERSGAVPILVTHAYKTSSPPTVRDRPQLDACRIFFPRALPEVMPAFDRAAALETLRLGIDAGWPTIDAAETLDGQRDFFADPVHFNDAGSRAMAELLARELLALRPRSRGPG